MIFALAGNQNCGKTTLFNQLTGSNQHVGNFPGVTVDSKTGEIRGYPEHKVVDFNFQVIIIYQKFLRNINSHYSRGRVFFIDLITLHYS